MQYIWLYLVTHLSYTLLSSCDAAVYPWIMSLLRYKIILQLSVHRQKVSTREVSVKLQVGRSCRPHLKLCVMNLGSCCGHLILQLGQLRLCCNAVDFACCVLQAGQLPLQPIHRDSCQIHLQGPGGRAVGDFCFVSMEV